MRTMHIFEDNGWFIDELDLAANRLHVTGPGRIGPVPAEETQRHLEFFKKQGVRIDDQRQQAQA